MANGYGLGGEVLIPQTIGQPPQQSFMGNIGDALSGAWDDTKQWTKENPNAMIVALDAIGKGFDPNNNFAGIGTMLAQSTMADNARNEQQGQNDQFQQQLMQALSGMQQPVTQPGQQTTGNMTPDAATGNETTAADQPGNTSVAYKSAPGGGQIKTTSEFLPSKPQQQDPQLTSMLPLLNP